MQLLLWLFFRVGVQVATPLLLGIFLHQQLVLDPIVNGNKHVRDATSVKNSFIKSLYKMNH